MSGSGVKFDISSTSVKTSSVVDQESSITYQVPVFDITFKYNMSSVGTDYVSSITCQVSV